MPIIITKNIDNRQSCEANARRNARRAEGDIEHRIKHEAEGRRIARRQIDIATGLTKSTDPQRGDYKLCREADKILKEYKEYKNPNDRKKIEASYFQLQRESRRNNYKLGNGG